LRIFPLTFLGLVHEDDPLRLLETGQPVGATAMMSRSVAVVPSRSDDGGDVLAPRWVRQPDHCCLRDGRMGVDDLFDLAGRRSRRR
jgi:hypothetical protein